MLRNGSRPARRSFRDPWRALSLAWPACALAVCVPQGDIRGFFKRPRDEGAPADAPAASAKVHRPAVDGAAAAALLQHLTEPGWLEALAKETSRPYFAELADKVAAQRAKATVFPPAPQVFSAFNLTPLAQVRVVILGQDPYHNTGQAHGLAFSVARGIAVPPSLKNIYTELEQDVPGFKRPGHGNLEAWAQRGVMLLNAGLTVRAHEANSHEKFGWHTFTDAVVQVLSRRATPTVFILWGGFAQKKGKVIDRSRHCVIEAAHPSPLSVTKFRGCKVFSKVRASQARGTPDPPSGGDGRAHAALLMCVRPQANAFLEKKGLAPIDWSIGP